MSYRPENQGMSSDARIVELMSDLSDALHSNPDMLFLGGGNPAHIPEFERIIAESLKKIADDDQALHQLIGIYQSPAGSEPLIAELAAYFQSLGWSVGPENICITNGSQSAFSILLNMFGGIGEDGQLRKIGLPLLPEYLGYVDQIPVQGAFLGHRPEIELIGNHEFRYNIDFDHLSLADDVKALCLSRPTNPSGNVLASEQIKRLGKMADDRKIPLILDCAYGSPFPNIEYHEDQVAWQPNRVFVFSLSKLGLPGVRTGIILADEGLIKEVASANTVKSLASGSFGPALLTELLKDKLLDGICKEILLPHYVDKRKAILNFIDQRFHGLPYRLHKSDGAFFVWLWFEGLPISSDELYQRLKSKGVLVVDGEPFFFDQFADWKHTKECIRLSYCAEIATLDKATEIIAEEVRSIYNIT